jgi:hypothetical protein
MASSMDTILSLSRLWNVAQADTGQSGVCVRLLLGLYNGPRFPFALTDLRRLDSDLLRAAFDVLGADASHALAGEVHDVLNRAYGRSDFGHRLEHMAHAWGCKGACTRANLPATGKAPILLKLPDRPAAPRMPAPPADRAHTPGAPWTGA